MTEPETLAELLVTSCRTNTRRVAVVDPGGELTYDGFLKRVGAAADELLELGVRPGDRVALLLLNSIDYAVAYFATAATGATAVLVNARLTLDEITHVLSDSGAKVTVTQPELLDRVPGADGTVALASDLGRARLDVTPFEQWAGLRRTASDVANILYTSGTTGKPKGAMQTHGNLMANFATVREQFGLTRDDVALIAAPLFHATAINSQLIPFIGLGARCVLVPTFDRAAVPAVMRDNRVTLFAGVGAMVELLALDPAFGQAAFPDLRQVVLGGSPVGESTLRVLDERLPNVDVANVWGMTEATSIVTVAHRTDLTRRRWTAGRAVPGVELQVWDEVGNKLPPSSVGELVVRGPVVTAGYWGRPEATAETFVDGWLRTGDVGRVDAEGFVQVLDRLKDMIIRGGENIYSVEVESVLSAHPDIAEVAVVGLPDPVFGERVCAVVVRVAGSAVSIEQIRDFARTRLADYKIPAEVRFLDALPRNASGKVLKGELPVDSG
ncbi:class I adenylate-forming enzyme family protein [Gordonia sp. VNK21]|uniref:class I adenylate-forming enzyme family protein n=1 Tax=Gordonia sp. VNK21 TaxID=3382483 RepID=UPI0038D3E7DB